MSNDTEIITHAARVTRFLTVGRLLWALAFALVGAVSSAAGCLYGEGQMRGAFQGEVSGNGRKITEIDRRLSAMEMAREGDRATWVALLTKVSSIEGSLDTLKVWLKPAAKAATHGGE